MTEAAADPSASAQATEDRIRMRAYELYEARNGGPGDADGDWYRAELELQSESAATAT